MSVSTSEGMEAKVKRQLIAAAALVGAIAVATPAFAVANLVTNGGFEMNGGNGELGFNTSATDWSVANPQSPTSGSYAFVYNAMPGPIGPGNLSGTTADHPGTTGIFVGDVALWGPDNGSANGLTVSPGGGAFLTASPTFHPGPITQTITGLTPGDNYVLSFDWAAGQQQGFDGATTEGWKATLGGASQSTTLVTLADKGFSGWMPATFEFTANASSEQLSFLAQGGPANPDLQGFSLLDDVSLVASPSPEPATWTFMIVGVGALGVALRQRRRAIAPV